MLEEDAKVDIHCKAKIRHHIHHLMECGVGKESINRDHGVRDSRIRCISYQEACPHAMTAYSANALSVMACRNDICRPARICPLPIWEIRDRACSPCLWRERRSPREPPRRDTQPAAWRWASPCECGQATGMRARLSGTWSRCSLPGGRPGPRGSRRRMIPGSGILHVSKC